MTIRHYIESYYTATANCLPPFPSVEGSLSCDVCVIGAGYTGLSSALHLAERGFQVMLLDANRIGWGASGRNGGQLGSGQRKDQDELERRLGKAHAHRLWELAEESKAVVKHRIERHAIACDLKPGILHPSHKPSLERWACRYVELLQNHYGYRHVRTVPRNEMREMLGTNIYHGGFLDTNAAHLHPLNFALGLARAARDAGVAIYEDTTALRCVGDAPVTVKTEHGQISAQYAILACNGYLGELESRLQGKIMPINNFILATVPLGEDGARAIIRDDVAVADSKFVINYFRLSADRRLLFGGGENYSSRFPKDLPAFVRAHMLKVYPQLADVSIEYAWGGTLAVTLNRMPHMGRLDRSVHFAQGYSGHGIGAATLAGKVLAEAIAGTAERLDVFASIPTRTFPGGRLLRGPALTLGMLYYALRDRL